MNTTTNKEKHLVHATHPKGIISVTHKIMWMLQGCAIGIAVLIPGISAGTLALIMGIYEKIIFTVCRIFPSPDSARTNHGKTFLFYLTIGIGCIILLLAKCVEYLLQYHPLPVYSFFIGLITASLPILFQKIQKNRITIPLIVIVSLICLASSLFIKNPHQILAPSFTLFFMSGVIGAFCAILPVLSGAAVLLVLGTYHLIIQAFNQLMWIHLSGFIVGVLLGLCCGFYFVQFLLKKYQSWIFAIILGFIIGYLPALFPTKAWNVYDPMISMLIVTTSIGLGMLLFYLLNTVNPHGMDQNDTISNK